MFTIDGLVHIKLKLIAASLKCAGLPIDERALNLDKTPMSQYKYGEEMKSYRSRDESKQWQWDRMKLKPVAPTTLIVSLRKPLFGNDMCKHIIAVHSSSLQNMVKSRNPRDSRTTHRLRII